MVYGFFLASSAARIVAVDPRVHRLQVGEDRCSFWALALDSCSILYGLPPDTKA